MIDGRNFSDQPLKIILEQLITFKYYTTGFVLDFSYFKKYYKIIAIDLSKQQVLDADLNLNHRFTGNLDKPGNATIYFIVEETKETILDFQQGAVTVL